MRVRVAAMAFVLCAASALASPPPPPEAGARPLTGEALRAAMTGASLVSLRDGVPYAEHLRPDGTLRGRSAGRDYGGSWWIEGDLLCRRIERLAAACLTVVHDGPALLLGEGASQPLRRVPGDVFAGPPQAGPGTLSPDDPVGELISWNQAPVVVGTLWGVFPGGMILASPWQLDFVQSGSPVDAAVGSWWWARGRRVDGVFRAERIGPYVPGQPVP